MRPLLFSLLVGCAGNQAQVDAATADAATLDGGMADAAIADGAALDGAMVDAATADAAVSSVPARYPHSGVSSPVTAAVAASLRQIAAAGAHHDDVFMKVGGSGTVSTNLLYCFAGLPAYTLDLD